MTNKYIQKFNAIQAFEASYLDVANLLADNLTHEDRDELQAFAAHLNDATQIKELAQTICGLTKVKQKTAAKTLVVMYDNDDNHANFRIMIDCLVTIDLKYPDIASPETLRLAKNKIRETFINSEG